MRSVRIGAGQGWGGTVFYVGEPAHRSQAGKLDGVVAGVTAYIRGGT